MQQDVSDRIHVQWFYFHSTNSYVEILTPNVELGPLGSE
jgi:hypothetical protein